MISTSHNIETSEPTPASSIQSSPSLQLPVAPDFLRKHWSAVTSDDNITLHGFRRFKTAHLLNLRLLEDEVAGLDYTIYQAGLSLGIQPSSTDRLGLRHCTQDSRTFAKDIITDDLIYRLRDLLKQYDEALAAFNRVMSMETCSLLDRGGQYNPRSDISLYEIYKTRLVRTDLEGRGRQDPFQRRLHQWLRDFRHWKLSRSKELNPESTTYKQNTILLAELAGRLIVAVVIALILVVPLAVLSHQSGKGAQLVTVSICIIVFSFLVAFMLKTTSTEVMVVSAAYAAVLSVFVSNVS